MWLHGYVDKMFKNKEMPLSYINYAQANVVLNKNLGKFKIYNFTS